MASKANPEVGLKELRAFLDSVKLNTNSVDANDAKTKKFYKKIFALLLFDYIIQSSSLSDEVKEYARESASDISHGSFLTFVNLYKPSRVSLRSGIENLLRYLLLTKGVDSPKIKDVYSLFETANRLFKENESQKKRIGLLHGYYSELCKSVHSAGSSYMNLKVPFNKMLEFDEKKFSENRKILHETISIVCEVLFIHNHNLVEEAHHSHKDILADSVSKLVKKEAREVKEKIQRK